MDSTNFEKKSKKSPWSEKDFRYIMICHSGKHIFKEVKKVKKGADPECGSSLLLDMVYNIVNTHVLISKH